MNESYNTFSIILNNDIKSSQLKNILFGMENIEADDIKGIGKINRLLTFGFILGFIIWKNDINKKNKLPDTPNANRVFDSFKCIYNGENIGLDLIIYIMTEMQLDVLSLGERSYFSNIITGGDDETVMIPAFRNLIKTWIQSGKHDEKDESKLLKKFIGLCNTFPFLSNIDVVYKKEDGFPFEIIDLKFNDKNEVLDTYLILIKNEFGVYYLTSFEKNEQEKKAKLVYHSLDGIESYHVELPNSVFFYRSDIHDTGSHPTSIFAKSLFSISFKYIKNLSLSLSDIITEPTKQKIYNHFSQKYNDVFEVGYKKEEELTWDNVITILMIEEGPTEILEFILDPSGLYFKRILENLEMRYHKEGFAHNVKKSFEKAQKDELYKLKCYIDDNSAISKNMDAINKTLMSKGIIDGLAILENKKESSALFVESLAVRIRNIDKIITSSDSNITKTIKINRALEKTFRYIIPFYHGIIAYQKEKEMRLNEIENENENSDIDKAKKEIMFKKCEESFFIAAKESIEKICNSSLGELINKYFKKLCFSLSGKEGKIRKLTDEGKLLKRAIGRDYICNLKTFDRLLNIELDKSMKLESYPKNILKFVNNVKHYGSSSMASANVVLYNKFLINIKQLLFFLIYNEDFEKEMILGQQISYDPIYPYVVRYSMKSENRDGYNINSFTVFPSDDEMKSEIKILSERDYEINEKYYCIPNESSSNNRWWIEPFMISCRKYDDLIHSSVNDEDIKNKIDEYDEYEEEDNNL